MQINAIANPSQYFVQEAICITLMFIYGLSNQIWIPSICLRYCGILSLVYWCICASPAFSALHIQVPINSIRPSDAYMHYCVTKLTIIVPDNGFVAWPAPSHYVKKCWNIVKSNIRNKFQWNLQRNSNICTQDNAFQMSPGKWQRKIHAREEKLTKIYRLYQRRRWCVYNFNCILKYFGSSRSLVYVSLHLSSHCHRW